MTDIKRKGRPTVVPGGNSARLPEVRCTEAELAIIRQAVQASGLTAGQWIRQSLLRAAGENQTVAEEDKATVYEQPPLEAAPSPPLSAPEPCIPDVPVQTPPSPERTPRRNEPAESAVDLRFREILANPDGEAYQQLLSKVSRSVRECGGEVLGKALRDEFHRHLQK